MKLEEMSLDQVKAALTAGSLEDTKAYLEKEGVELPRKVPQELPEEIEKFAMKLWQAVKFPPREVCADDEHDFQPTGKCEMSRNEATLPGSCFSREFRCTKCGTYKWVRDKEPEKKEEEAADAPADDREARRAARKAEREAKKAAAEAGEAAE